MWTFNLLISYSDFLVHMIVLSDVDKVNFISTPNFLWINTNEDKSGTVPGDTLVPVRSVTITKTALDLYLIHMFYLTLFITKLVLSRGFWTNIWLLSKVESNVAFKGINIWYNSYGMRSPLSNKQGLVLVKDNLYDKNENTIIYWYIESFMQIP